MTQEKPLKFVFEVSGSLTERILSIAKEEGMATPEQWVETQFEKFIGRIAAQDTDLKPKEAAKALGIEMWTMRRLMKEGRFPNMCYVNSRVIRIPQADIDAFRQSRTLAVT